MASAEWARFEDSLTLDYERWHGGVGIDLDALALLAGDERERAESLLLRGPLGWREAQALAVLDTPSARAALGAVLDGSDREAQMAVVRAAPQVLAEGQLEALLVDGLAHATIGHGFSAISDMVEVHHPPVVLAALTEAVRTRRDGEAVNLAALLDFLLGPATEAFDWDHRPLYLRFLEPPGTPDRDEAWRELSARLDLPPPAEPDLA